MSISKTIETLEFLLRGKVKPGERMGLTDELFEMYEMIKSSDKRIVSDRWNISLPIFFEI